MSQSDEIHLNSSCILNVPLQTYDNNFTFIVNNEKFKTSRLISDLLSPKISKIHSTDPTFDVFTINTQQKGNFSNILQLVNFNKNIISESELPFILEVIEILGNESIEYSESKEPEEITTSNVFTQIKKHEKFGLFYKKRLLNEIEFIASHFFELFEKEENEEELSKLQFDTLIKIISNEKLKLRDEDQLLKFVNSLYSSDSKFTSLYEFVAFENVSSDAVCEFAEIFNMNDLTNGTWNVICQRLKQETKNEKKVKSERYSMKGENFPYSENKVFNGIINYLRSKSSGKIENEMNATASSYCNDILGPFNATIFDDQTKYFHSRDLSNSWICFDFKEHRVIPTKYTIKSEYRCGPNNYHPKNWVIEGSEDGNSWEILDEEKDCSYLNDQSVHHTFDIKNQSSKEFRFIRMRQTGKNWHNDDYLIFDSLEIYGQYI